MANKWGNNGNSERLYILGYKITADGDCSHEIKRCLLLGRKAIINPRLIKLKSRDITLPTKVHLVKAMFFSSSCVWMWELDCEENWAPKNWCFWTVVLEKTLESPLDCKDFQSVHPKGNQSWIFIEVLMLTLKLKLQYLGHLIRRIDSFEKTLILGIVEGRRRSGWQKIRWLYGITDLMDLSLVMDREAWHAAVNRAAKSQTRLSDWTELKWSIKAIIAIKAMNLHVPEALKKILVKVKSLCFLLLGFLRSMSCSTKKSSCLAGDCSSSHA